MQEWYAYEIVLKYLDWYHIFKSEWWLMRVHPVKLQPRSLASYLWQFKGEIINSKPVDHCIIMGKDQQSKHSISIYQWKNKTSIKDKILMSLAWVAKQIQPWKFIQEKKKSRDGLHDRTKTRQSKDCEPSKYLEVF